MTNEMIESIESKIRAGGVVKLPIGHALQFFKYVSERMLDRRFEIHFNQGFVFIY